MSAESRRLLILAEGFSGDPHYGKTMRGVLRYRRDDVVAILDSTRAGEDEQGVPIVGDVAAALPFEPTAALVGVATQGGRFPPAWREVLRDVHPAGDRDRERAARVRRRRSRARRARARRSASTLTDLRRPPAGLDVPTGANLEVPGKIVLTVGSDCAIGKMTVSLELDREARARGIASVFVPTGQTGIAIAGWGLSVDAVVADFIAGAAERLVVEGGERGGDLLLRRGAGRDLASGVLGRHARPHPRLGAARVRALPPGRRDRDRGLPGPSAAARCRSSSSCTSGSRSRAGRAAVACIALNTRHARRRRGAGSDRAGGGRDGPRRGRPGPVRRRPPARRTARAPRAARA